MGGEHEALCLRLDPVAAPASASNSTDHRLWLLSNSEQVWRIDINAACGLSSPLFSKLT